VMRLVSGLMTWTDVSLIGRERRRARREIKSSRNGVHIANGVVREPVCFVAHLARAAGAAARRPRRRPTDTAGRRGRPNPVTPPARRGHRDRDRGLAPARVDQRHAEKRLVLSVRVDGAESQGRSIQANVGVEFKGVSWS